MVPCLVTLTTYKRVARVCEHQLSFLFILYVALFLVFSCCIGVNGPECFYDGAIRRSKMFSDRFSRFDTIPAVTDTQPPSHVAISITLNAKASSLKTRNQKHHLQSDAIPAGYCHTHILLYVSGVNYNK